MTPGLSLSIKISSSISWGPKVQFLLVGKEINLALSVTGAKRKKNRGKSIIGEKHFSSWLLEMKTHTPKVRGKYKYFQVKLYSPTVLMVNLPSSSIMKSKPFFLNISRFSISTASLTAVKFRVWGLKYRRLKL